MSGNPTVGQIGKDMEMVGQTDKRGRKNEKEGWTVIINKLTMCLTAHTVWFQHPVKKNFLLHLLSDSCSNFYALLVQL